MPNPRRLYLVVLAGVFAVSALGLVLMPSPLHDAFVAAFTIVGLLAGSGAVAETVVRELYRRYARSHCGLCPDGVPSPTFHPNGQLAHSQPSRILRP